MRLIAGLTVAALSGLAAGASQQQSANVYIFATSRQSSAETPSISKEVARHILLQRASSQLGFTVILHTNSLYHRLLASDTAATCATFLARLIARPQSTRSQASARARHHSLLSPARQMPLS